MFASFSRSWRFAKASYSLVWRHKRLLVFPLFSGIAAILVLASFLPPLHQTGALAAWSEAATESGEQTLPPAAWITLFIYYVVNYFVIVFFKAGLVVCAMRSMQGQPVRVMDGLSEAAKRWYAILCWAVVSSVVSVILRALESNKKTGRFVVAILGTAWTAMTYFVIPIIVIDSRGPIQAVRDSANTLKQTWGTALTGNFSMGLINFVVVIPMFILIGFLLWMGFSVGTPIAVGAAIAVAVILILTFGCLSSAAGMVFKAILFSYATGKSLPETVPAAELANAFRQAPDR